MGTKDPRIDDYIARARPFARPILKYIRKAVHAGCPEVEETLKWSHPSFMYKGILCAWRHSRSTSRSDSGRRRP